MLMKMEILKYRGFMTLINKIKIWYWRLRLRFGGQKLITINEATEIKLCLPLPIATKNRCFGIQNLGKANLIIVPPTKAIRIDGIDKKVLLRGQAGVIFSDGENFFGVYSPTSFIEFLK